MAVVPELNEKTSDYIFSTAERLLNNPCDRIAGSGGEKDASEFYLNELRAYSDESTAESFCFHPKAVTLIEKTLAALLMVNAVLFIIAESFANIFLCGISSVLSLLIFSVFSYKFIFDGTALDKLFKKKSSQNIFTKRYSSGTPEKRIVLVTHADAPPKLRSILLGGKAPYILTVCSVVGNTLLFCSEIFYLFAGAPKDSALFAFLSVLSAIFIVFYFCAFLLISPNKSAPGVTASIIPTLTVIGLFKQMSEKSFRFQNTEICCLITGGEYAGRAGSYAFAGKYKRLFRDIPTTFITIDEITTSKKMAVIFHDGSGTTGSTETASSIAAAAENLGIALQKENQLLGTASFTPFSKQHFSAAAVGTSKKHISKSHTGAGDTLSAVSKKTVSDTGSLLFETLNYYGH